MEKKRWTLINAENVEPYVCEGGYSSKQLTGDEIAGLHVPNINEGVLKGGCRTGGGAHEETEIYYIVSGSAILWLDDESFPVKPGDIIVIPPHVFHWIDNTMNTEDFKLFTVWSKQEENEMYFVRKNAWGTCIKYIDKDYTKKRLEMGK